MPMPQGAACCASARCALRLSGAWPQVSLDANAFLVGILARQAAKQPEGPSVASAIQMSTPQIPPPASPAADAGTAAGAPASTLAPVLGSVATASAANTAAAACCAEVRVSAPWPTGNKAAGYAATVSLIVTNTASTGASAPLQIAVYPNTTQAGYVDAGNGQAWGWDSFSVSAGTAQGSIMQVCQPARSLRTCPGTAATAHLQHGCPLTSCEGCHALGCSCCVLLADQRTSHMVSARAPGAAAWRSDVQPGRHPCVQRPGPGAVKGYPERRHVPSADCQACTPLGSLVLHAASAMQLALGAACAHSTHE